MPPDVLPEKLALILPCAQARSTKSMVSFGVSPDSVPVNGAVNEWSSFKMLLPWPKATLALSEEANSRLELLAKLKEPVVGHRASKDQL